MTELLNKTAVIEAVNNNKKIIIACSIAFVAGFAISAGLFSSKITEQTKLNESIITSKVSEAKSKMQDEFAMTLTQKLSEQKKIMETASKSKTKKTEIIKKDGTVIRTEEQIVENKQKTDNSTITADSTVKKDEKLTTEATNTVKENTKTELSITSTKYAQKKWSLGLSAAVSVGKLPTSLTSNVESVTLHVDRNLFSDIWLKAGVQSNIVNAPNFSKSTLLPVIGFRLDF